MSDTDPGGTAGDSQPGSTTGVPPVDCSEFTVTWGADVDVVIPSGQTVCIEQDVQAKSVTVEAGGRLWASRLEHTTMTVHGNVVVEGLLDYGAPNDRISAHAEIVLASLDDFSVHGMGDFSDGEYILSGVEFFEGDQGVWVRGNGVFAAAGTVKSSWGFLVDGASGSDTTIEVDDATGWEAGDVIVLTPTVERDQIPIGDAGEFAPPFDELTVESVDGNRVALTGAMQTEHAGCSDCWRRGEAINLTRNVVVRSADDGNRGHVAALDQGAIQLDSVELKWLGPGAYEWDKGKDGACTGSDGERPALFFGNLGSAGTASFVRHVSIHDSRNTLLAMSDTTGVELTDIAAYDTPGMGFSSWGRNDDTVLDHVLIGDLWFVDTDGRAGTECGATSGLAFGVPHGIGSGFRGCAAVGTSGRGLGQDFRFAEYLEDSVFHHNGEYGIKWRAAHDCSEHPFRNNNVWSNGSGVWIGDYGTSNRLESFVIADNGASSLEIQSVSQRGYGEPDFVDLVIDHVFIGAYTISVGNPHELLNVTWTGAYPVAIDQIEEQCSFGPGEEDNFASFECAPSWLQVLNPTFPANVKPFEFGDQINRRAFWEIRGFGHPDGARYGSLPANFNLYRPDNQVSAGEVGGTAAYMHDDSVCGAPGCGFNAWLVEFPDGAGFSPDPDNGESTWCTDVGFPVNFED